MPRSLTIAFAVAVSLAVALPGAAAQDGADGAEYAERPARPGRKFPVVIASEPKGATVYLDGKEYGPVGRTPLRTRLAPGDYRLVLELEGHERLETTFTVRRRRSGRQRFAEKLVPKLLGMISVSAPAGAGSAAMVGAVVNIDGEPVGYAPLDHEIELGPHQVLVELEDGRVFEEWVEVTIEEPVVVEPEFELEPEPPEAEAEAEAEPERFGRETGRPDAAMVNADLGFEFGGRFFRYAGGTTDNLRPYDAFGVPVVRVGAAVYPLAGSASARLRALGLEARLAFAPALESRTSTGDQTVDTRWQRFEIGARVRHRAGAALLGAAVGYHQETFDFADSSAIADEVPDVAYRALYVGADARLPVGIVNLLAGARLMPVLSAGQTADRFAGARVFGIGARLGAAYPLRDRIELRAEAAYRGFFYGLDAVEGDEFIATGATDSLLGLTVTAAFFY